MLLVFSGFPPTKQKGCCPNFQSLSLRYNPTYKANSTASPFAAPTIQHNTDYNAQKIVNMTVVHLNTGYTGIQRQSKTQVELQTTESNASSSYHETSAIELPKGGVLHTYVDIKSVNFPLWSMGD